MYQTLKNDNSQNNRGSTIKINHFFITLTKPINSTLASSENRSLWSIYTKFRKLKRLGCFTFTNLYHSGVTPILDYASGIWGYKTYDKIDTVQNRAIHLYLGVYAFDSNHAINGDMGWIYSSTRKLEMIRMWNWLIKMDNTCLTKNVFLWVMSCRRQNLNLEILSILTSIGQEDAHQNKTYVNVNNVRSSLCEIDKQSWKTNVTKVPKLRTFIKHKDEYLTEIYAYQVYDRGQRSIMAEFRSGILPFRIETGRYTYIPKEFRLCNFCHENCVENEEYFLFHSSLYSHMRYKLIKKATNFHNNFLHFQTDEQFRILMVYKKTPKTQTNKNKNSQWYCRFFVFCILQAVLCTV